MPAGRPIRPQDARIDRAVLAVLRRKAKTRDELRGAHLVSVALPAEPIEQRAATLSRRLRSLRERGLVRCTGAAKVWEVVA